MRLGRRWLTPFVEVALALAATSCVRPSGLIASVGSAIGPFWLRPLGVPAAPARWLTTMSGSKGGREVGGNSGGGKGFRNPHNLPVKDCLVCGRPFTWRKKWEKCWDEVLTCSDRCKRERRNKNKADTRAAVGGGAAAGAVAMGGNTYCESDEDTTTDYEASDQGGGSDSEARAAAPAASRSSSPVQDDEAEERQDSDDEEDEDGAAEPRVLTAKEQKRLRKQEAKAAKRSSRRGASPEAVDAKRKPCDICERRVDLLVRSQCDSSRKWKMLCGRCWKDASGGVPDGDADHPYYRYGGLWKNRAAKVTTPSFSGGGGGSKSIAQVVAAQEAAESAG